MLRPQAQSSLLLRSFLSRKIVTKAPPATYMAPEANEVAFSKQQAARPLSPHLTIYEPQLTALMSIGHRMTGAALSAGIYAFGVYYTLASPASGQLTPAVAEFIAHSCPTVLVYAGKYILAAPFVYHTLNGIRHLVSLPCASAC